MKKVIRRLSAIVLAMIMAISVNMPVRAEEASVLPLKESVEMQMKENLAIIEEELNQQGTSVVEELNNAILWLEEEKTACTDAKEREKVQAIIDTTKRLLQEYVNYSSGIEGQGVDHPVYTPAVAAVASYFSACGYRLSFELLTHAQDNNVLDSTYIPHYGYLIDNSIVVRRIASEGITSGTAEFPNSGSTTDQDLYYAIHNFSYTFTKSTRVFVLSDRYDFALGDYNGIAGAAVDTMYMAQLTGVLVPYYVKITRVY